MWMGVKHDDKVSPRHPLLEAGEPVDVEAVRASISEVGLGVPVDDQGLARLQAGFDLLELLPSVCRKEQMLQLGRVACFAGEERLDFSADWCVIIGERHQRGFDAVSPKPL